MEGCAIASPNMRPRRDVPQDGVRRNEMIRAREVRVIGADGEQLGILQRNEAIALAKEAGMDLVEVASTSEPPVCRIMDYGKFKYEQQKKKQEAKKRQSVVQIKEIKVRPKTDEHQHPRTRRAGPGRCGQGGPGAPCRRPHPADAAGAQEVVLRQSLFS